MPEQEHTTEKKPYIGSVRFFKNLLLLLVIVLITIPTVAAVCLYHSGRDVKEQLRLLQERDTAQARYSTDEMSAEASPAAPAGEVNDPLSYQQLYPDFYAEEPAPAQVTRENTMYLTFDDGPSDLTPEFLQVLEEKDVRPPSLWWAKPMRPPESATARSWRPDTPWECTVTATITKRSTSRWRVSWTIPTSCSPC